MADKDRRRCFFVAIDHATFVRPIWRARLLF
jgi:hypothetical protein